MLSDCTAIPTTCVSFWRFSQHASISFLRHALTDFPTLLQLLLLITLTYRHHCPSLLLPVVLLLLPVVLLLLLCNSCFAPVPRYFLLLLILLLLLLLFLTLCISRSASWSLPSSSSLLPSTSRLLATFLLPTLLFVSLLSRGRSS